MIRQRGFTLIELMVVVGILGILASIALPVYQNYTIRAKVSEGLQLVSAAKLAVAETWIVQGQLPTGNTSAGLAAADQIRGDHVRSISVSDEGSIVVTFSAVEPAINGKTISFIPQTGRGSVKWTCLDTDIQSRYLPPQCRL